MNLLQSYQDKTDSSAAFGSSFPKEFHYGMDNNEPDSQTMPASQKPRILLMGLRRSVFNILSVRLAYI